MTDVVFLRQLFGPEVAQHRREFGPRLWKEGLVGVWFDQNTLGESGAEPSTDELRELAGDRRWALLLWRGFLEGTKPGSHLLTSWREYDDERTYRHYLAACIVQDGTRVVSHPYEGEGPNREVSLLCRPVRQLGVFDLAEFPELSVITRTGKRTMQKIRNPETKRLAQMVFRCSGPRAVRAALDREVSEREEEFDAGDIKRAAFEALLRAIAHTTGQKPSERSLREVMEWLAAK